MANFPISPAVGEQFSTSKVTYRWNGSAWDIVEGVKQGTIQEYAGSGPDVKLLLHAEDTTDSSLSGQTLTFSGNTTTSSTKKKFGSTSFYFDGTSDYIDCPDLDDFDFGTGDFTIEFWFNTDQTNVDPQGFWRRMFALKQAANTGTNFQISYATNGTNKLWSWFNDNDDSEYGDSAITDGNWHHIAAVRASGILTIYVDGVSKHSQAYVHNLTGCQPRFGSCGHDGTLGNFDGYMDEIRITKGAAQYTENFSVATSAFANPALTSVGNLQFAEGSEPNATAGASTLYATSGGMFVKNSSGSVTALTANATLAAPTAVELATVTNTPSAIALTGQMVHWDRSAEVDASEVLLLHAEDGADSSSSNHTLTLSGASVSTAQKKFGNSSFLFNGSTNYISMPQSDNFTFDADFCIEFWAFKAGAGDEGYDVAIGCNTAGGGSGLGWFIEWSNSRGFNLYDGHTNNAVVMNWDYDPDGTGWNHVAFTREGTTCRLFVNGDLKKTVTYSNTLTCGQALYLGQANNGSWSFNGYLDEVRICKGAAKYTANFNVPSAPYAAATSGLYYVAPDGTKTLIQGDS
jgi:hypothetical protein